MTVPTVKSLHYIACIWTLRQRNCTNHVNYVIKKHTHGMKQQLLYEHTEADGEQHSEWIRGVNTFHHIIDSIEYRTSHIQAF